MNLPRLMLITHYVSMQPNFSVALERALRGGARWIQFREPESTPLQVLADCETAQKRCKTFGATFSMNAVHGSYSGCIHWPQRFLDEPHQRALDLNGYSVHDIQSAKQAQQIGADYLLFGHVFPTFSHHEEPRGLDALREVCAKVNIPVLAIGGINAQNAKSCLEAGAHGIAVMRNVWSGDVERNVSELLGIVGD